MSLQRGFFDLDERYQRLSEAGDPLERLLELVAFEMFRSDIEMALAYGYRWRRGSGVSWAGYPVLRFVQGKKPRP